MSPFVEGTCLTPTDHQYHEIISDVLENGNLKGDRTGTGTIAVVGRLARYSLLNKRSPRPTTKKVTDNPEREMLWFRNGSSSIKELRDQNIGIWNSWLVPGTAQYRPMTQPEVEKAIEKAINAKHGAGTFDRFVHSPVWEAGDFAENPLEDGKIQVIWVDLESLHKFYTAFTGKEAQVLMDGDIGAGGYGPQWRHWKDTQVIDRHEYEAYVAQGYQAIAQTHERHLGDLNHLSGGKLVMHREIDQLANAVELLHTQPDSRRIIVTAWNPALTWKAALPPCHLYFQFISHELTLEQRYAIAKDRMELEKYDIEQEQIRTGVMDAALRTWMRFDLEADRKDCSDEQLHANMDILRIKRRGLYCFLLLRSNDLGLGQPFNVAQYAALTHMVAQVTGMEALELVWTAVDAHVYANHVDALQHQLTLESKNCIPRLKLNPEVTKLDDFTINDIKIVDYESHEALTNHMPPAV